jgi:hypothetical protein
MSQKYMKQFLRFQEKMKGSKFFVFLQKKYINSGQIFDSTNASQYFQMSS